MTPQRSNGLLESLPLLCPAYAGMNPAKTDSADSYTGAVLPGQNPIFITSLVFGILNTFLTASLNAGDLMLLGWVLAAFGLSFSVLADFEDDHIIVRCSFPEHHCFPTYLVFGKEGDCLMPLLAGKVPPEVVATAFANALQEEAPRPEGYEKATSIVKDSLSRAKAQREVSLL